MSYVPAFPPKIHQTEALSKAYDKPAFGYLMDMGTGKSKTILDEIGRYYVEGKIDAALITSGKGSYATWAEIEIPKHLGIPVWTHLWRGGTTQREKGELRSFLSNEGGHKILRILVINIEAIAASPAALKAAAYFVQHTKCYTAVDESTLIKNHQAMRTIQMVKLGAASKFRRIATGSPVTKNPLDLWGQFAFLGKDLLGTNSFYAFRARYMVLKDVVIGGRNIKMPVGVRSIDKLTAILKEHSFRVLKSECLDLEPKVYQFRNVELTEEQKKAYDELKRFAETTLLPALEAGRGVDVEITAEQAEGAVIVANSALSMLLRMHQVVCGQVMDENGVIHEVPTNRIKELLQICEETDDKIIIWCAYRSNVDAVMHALNKEYGEGAAVRYDGGVSREDRKIAIDRFQEGDARFFVATPHTGARGITLTASATTVYFSNTYDLELRSQSEDRNHRIGQTRSVTYIDLIARGTVEEKIIKSLRDKIDIATAVVGDNPRAWVI